MQIHDAKKPHGKKQAEFLWDKTINTVATNISINIKKRHRQNQER